MTSTHLDPDVARRGTPPRPARLRRLVAICTLSLALFTSGCGESSLSASRAECTADADCDGGRCMDGACEIAVDVDAEIDARAAQDVPVLDANEDGLSVEVGVDAGSEFGEPCTTDDECRDDFCLVDGAEGVCTTLCDGSCPDPSWSCRLLENAGGDVVRLCIPPKDIVCEPCDRDLDCGGLADLCEERLDGTFCTQDCSDTGRCPDGSECTAVTRVVGDETVEHEQCVPIDDVCTGCLDSDGDGFGIGPDCLGADCDDTTAARYAGNVERCDGIDNDCDDVADEGFDFETDPEHCGACGNACDLTAADAICLAGACAIERCLDGHHDINGDPTDGCEYRCETNEESGGTELCNERDDDCDGEIDETFALDTDMENCGRCGRVCALAGATSRCEARECVIDSCDVDRLDCNELAEDGCEVQLQSDPEHCGACGTSCALPGAAVSCVAATCQLDTCLDGFVDLDGRPENGCEYECTATGDVDIPDPSYTDADCDGVDGSVERSIFVRASGDDGNAGTSPTTPVRTLARALALADALDGRQYVLVATGTYESSATLDLPTGVHIFGGYSADFRARTSDRAAFATTAPSAVRAIGLRAPTSIDQVDLATGNQSTPSAATTTVVVSDSADHLTITNANIVAGNGATGASGAAGARGSDGARGASASGQTGGGGGSVGGGRGGNGNRRSRGDGGSAGAANGSSCGGSGGTGGSDNLGCGDGLPERGGDGGDGCTGSGGSNGGGGDARGAVSPSGWSPSHGAGGGRGGTGGGGGGAGGGGGENCCIFGNICGTGRGGGGGGGGGQGGDGGSGGRGGGASIGLLVASSTVQLGNVAVRAGNGGDGGPGGAGGAGGSGGRGGVGATSSDDDDGPGGTGGSGGRGGTGGCGGGGGGGPSVAIWGTGAARVARAGSVTLTAGAGGSGGTSCGAAGRNGIARDTLDVTLD